MFGVGILLKIAGWFTGANLGTVATTITSILKNKDDAAHLKDKLGVEIAGSYLESHARVQEIKARTQTERQVIFGLFAFATPCALIWWAACLDSVPFYIPLLMDEAHRIGSWKVAIPPAFEADFHTIVQSFFIAAPTLAGVSMLARIFGKK